MAAGYKYTGTRNLNGECATEDTRNTNSWADEMRVRLSTSDSLVHFSMRFIVNSDDYTAW